MDIIRKARKEKGITQQELAERIGVNRATISKYESGQISIPFAQFMEIASALEIDSAEWIVAAMASEYDGDGKLSLDAAIRREYKVPKGYTYLVFVYNVDEKLLFEEIIKPLEKLNDLGYAEVAKRIEELAQLPKYQRNNAPTSDFGNSEDKDTDNAKKPPEGEKTTSDGI